MQPHVFIDRTILQGLLTLHIDIGTGKSFRNYSAKLAENDNESGFISWDEKVRHIRDVAE